MAAATDTTAAGGEAGKSNSTLTRAKKAIAAVVGSEADASQKSSAEAGLDDVRAAKTGFATTSRWVLGAFTAVGVLIFGSLPFANISRVRLGTLEGLIFLTGLLLAAIGISLAVWATSVVAEPEDASLGELDQDLAGVSKEKGYRLRPRKRALAQLKKVLSGTDASAHLGPTLQSVSALIDRIRTLQESRLDPAKKAAAEKLEVAGLLADLELEYDRLTQLEKSAITDGKVLSDVSVSRAEIGRIRGQLNEAASRLSATSKELACIDEERQLYLRHRRIVLVESAFVQLRGKFVASRRFIIAGAIATTLGGALYATSLPATVASSGNDPAFAAGRSASVIVNPGAPAAKLLPKACVGQAVSALLIGESNSSGPFRALVLDERCPGLVAVGEGQGTAG